MAPEVLQGDYNYKCDIWSCGVILYILLTGRPPFGGRNQESILKRVKRGTYKTDFKEFKRLSSSAQDLINKMLQYKPEDRPTAEECFNHPWIKQNETHSVDKIDMDILDGFRNFYYETQLQKCLYFFLANNLTSDEDQQKMIETFRAFDENGDGTLCRNEIREGYRKLYGSSRDEELEIILARVDSDGEDTINYSGEFEKIFYEFFSLFSLNFQIFLFFLECFKFIFLEFLMASIDRRKLLTKDKIEACFYLFDKVRKQIKREKSQD